MDNRAELEQRLFSVAHSRNISDEDACAEARNLLAAGAPANGSRTCRYLIWTVRNKKPLLAALLLEHGAHPLALSDYNVHALHYATDYDDKSISDLLFANLQERFNHLEPEQWFLSIHELIVLERANPHLKEFKNYETYMCTKARDALLPRAGVIQAHLDHDNEAAAMDVLWSLVAAYRPLYDGTYANGCCELLQTMRDGSEDPHFRAFLEDNIRALFDYEGARFSATVAEHFRVAAPHTFDDWQMGPP